MRSTTDTIRHELLGFVAFGPISISQACGEPGTAAARATVQFRSGPGSQVQFSSVTIPNNHVFVQTEGLLSLSHFHFLFSFTHFVSAARAWLNSSRIKSATTFLNRINHQLPTCTQVVERGSRNLNLQPQVSLARISYPPFPSALNSRRYSFGTSLLVRVRKIRLSTFLRLLLLIFSEGLTFPSLTVDLSSHLDSSHQVRSRRCGPRAQVVFN